MKSQSGFQDAMMLIFHRMRLVITFLYILMISAYATGVVTAQPSSVPSIILNEDIDGRLMVDFIRVDTSTAVLTPDEAWLRLSGSSHNGEYFRGLSQDYHWLGFTAVHESDSDIWFLEVMNPHLNVVKMWIRADESHEWELVEHTGRSAPFHSRRISHYNYAMPLNFSFTNTVDIVMMFDKRGSSISYPIRIWSAELFNTVQQRNYIVYGVYFGVFAIILLVIGAAFLFSLRMVFLWYFVYAASVAIFVFNDIGLAHQYLYPASDSIGSLMRVGLTYVMVLSFNLFTMTYFRMKQLFPLMHKLVWAVCIGVILHAAAYLLTTNLFRENITLMLLILYVIIILSIVFALITAFRYVQHDRYTAYLFISAFAFIFIASFIFILGEFGLFGQFGYLLTPLQVGYAVEIILLSCGLDWQVREVERSKMKLNERIIGLKNESLRAYIEGSEKERSRVAMDLHDTIGNRLAHLKRNMEKNRFELSQNIHEIGSVITDVRRLSHRLTPPGAEIFDLPEQIQQLVDSIQESSTIDYKFQALEVPSDLSDEIRIQLSRIAQEGVENIEKHSQASSAEIQLIGHPDELVLTIEDDGIGMDITQTSTNGIGIENMRRRAAFIGGDVTFTSVPENGLQIMVSIPLK